MKYMKLGSKPDLFQTDGSNIRSVETELATDIIVKVGDVKFYLHKFPLLSKSSRLQKLVAAINEESTDEINISNIPGGPPAFEICAKFCYGMIVTLNAYNVVAARCASEYLEMHETVEKGNLIYKIEVFLNSSIFRSWKDSIIVLQSTKSLEPWSEDLKLVGRSIDSIASKASINPSEVEWTYTYNRKNEVRKLHSVPRDWWIEDLCELEMDFYERVIMNIKIKGRSSPKVIGEALKVYTYKWGILSHGDHTRNRAMLETIIWLLPKVKGSVSCSFLLKLLKAAILLHSEEDCKKDLVKRIGRQLHEASVRDLLIPSSDGANTIYDVDVILIIFEEFAMQEHGSAESSPEISEELTEVKSPIIVVESSKVAVANLVDGYLAEVSKDPNLPTSKFIELVEMVSNSSRPVHDGLYRAIDMYLKEHPDITKSEKKKICSLMDCKKLSPDACLHAVQNERLPLRLVVQILFFEQIRASAAITVTTNTTATCDPNLPGSFGSSRSAATTNTENESDNHPKTTNPVGTVSEQCNGSESISSNNKTGNGKVKGKTMPKKLLSKLWYSKGRSGGENSNSDTSESPGGSVHPEMKSTPSRNTRHSVS